MKRLKVLMLIHELSLSGAPKVALDLVEALGNAIEVRFVAPADGPLGARCRALGSLFLPLAPLPPGRLQWRLEQRRRQKQWSETLEWKPDLIYANSVMSVPLAERLERTLGLPDAPILLHVHELDSLVAEVKATHDDWFLNRPSTYVGVSSAVCRRLVEYSSVDAAKVKHVPAFVREADFAAMHISPVPPGAPEPGKPTIVGGAGSVGWRKNTTLWLQAAAELVALPHVRFRWVGVLDGPAGDSFRVKRGLLGLEQKVELMGVTNQPLKAFSAFDLFLLTSWEDSFPLVVLENMMLGKPVVCVPGGGAPEEVGETGVVVNAFSPAPLADALRLLIEDPARRRQLGLEARQRVLEHFTDRVCVPQLWEVMQATAARS